MTVKCIRRQNLVLFEYDIFTTYNIPFGTVSSIRYK